MKVGGSHCLPAGCKIRKREVPFLSTTVDCKYQGLTTFPHDIPSNADRADLLYNAIRTVTSLPHLPQLYSLDLSDNSIETTVWETLCNLPALGVLYLRRNRLQYVQLSTVIDHLPKLRQVYLSNNKIVSCSLYDVGWPQVTTAFFRWNPAPCDCLYSGGLPVETCMDRGQVSTRCSSCSVCYFVSGRRREDLYCKSPDKTRKHSSANVSTYLAECERRMSMTRAATTEMDTTRAITTAAQRTLQGHGMDTSISNDKLNPLHLTRKATSTTATVSVKTDAFTNASHLSTTKISHNKDSSATVPTQATQTGIAKSSPSPKVSKDQELPIPVYVSIVAFECLLALLFISCFFRLLMKKRSKMGCNRRQEVNVGRPSIPLQQISPPIPNNTQSTGGFYHEGLAVPDGDQHTTESEHHHSTSGPPSTAAAPCSLYTGPTDADSANGITGQGQSQTNTGSLDARNLSYGPGPTDSQLNSLYKKATAMTSGHDHRRQGQSQTNTEFNTNTTATVVASGHDKAGQGQSKANAQSLTVANLSRNEVLAALQPNPMYLETITPPKNPTCIEMAIGHDQAGQGHS
ncbi:hypothetical protein Bbelb_039330 [Branchiostoma belcheri]|nr:hypothetical protein Bbelb_039330 [Branchiostoma belcheri]